jgi:thioredoxin
MHDTQSKPNAPTAYPWQDEIGFIPHLPGQPEAINADSFDEDVLQSPVPVAVEFWAARCGPCRRLAPEMHSASQSLAGRAKFFTLNVDEEPEAAARFGVLSIPAVLVFVHGEEKTRVVGVFDRSVLVQLVQPYIKP